MRQCDDANQTKDVRIKRRVWDKHTNTKAFAPISRAEESRHHYKQEEHGSIREKTAPNSHGGSVPIHARRVLHFFAGSPNLTKGHDSVIINILKQEVLYGRTLWLHSHIDARGSTGKGSAQTSQGNRLTLLQTNLCEVCRAIS